MYIHAFTTCVDPEPSSNRGGFYPYHTYLILPSDPSDKWKRTWNVLHGHARLSTLPLTSNLITRPICPHIHKSVVVWVWLSIVLVQGTGRNRDCYLKITMIA